MDTKALIVICTLTVLIGCSRDDSDTVTGIIETDNVSLRNHLATQIRFTTTTNIVKATYYLDGISIGSSIGSPYAISYTPIDIMPGQHEITCIVETVSGKEISFKKDVTLIIIIGDEYKGGIVFHVESNGLHGLIASKNDLALGEDNIFRWGQSGILNTTKNDGQENTPKMITVSPDISYAAFHFKNGYNHAGFTDWFIPAIDELKLLKENKELVGGFSTETSSGGLYWSSSELSETNAEALNFNVLMGNSYSKASAWLKIRPIRKF